MASWNIAVNRRPSSEPDTDAAADQTSQTQVAMVRRDGSPVPSRTFQFAAMTISASTRPNECGDRSF
jgi:hypothetical protein